MSEEPAMEMDDVTSDDRLWAALGYVFSPFIPLVLLLMEGKKDRPFIKAHNAQALAFGVAIAILTIAGSVVVIGICIWPLGFIAQLFWGYKAYQGEYVTIPVVTDFVKKQGWA